MGPEAERVERAANVEITRLRSENVQLKISLSQADQAVERATSSFLRMERDLKEANEALMGGPEGRGKLFASVMADGLWKMCAASGTQNYVELNYRHGEHPFTVTVKRHEGKSPGQIVAEAHEILTEITGAIAEGEDASPHLMAAVAWLARTSAKYTPAETKVTPPEAPKFTPPETSIKDVG